MNERISLADKKSEAKSQNSVPQIRRKVESPRSMSSPVDRILYLQRTIGNQAVQRLIKSGALQAKLRIGQPGDIYEQEADRVAEQVMKMPDVSSDKDNRILRKCPKCLNGLRGLLEKDKKDEKLQAKETQSKTHEVTSKIETNIDALKGGGQPLPESTKAFFEPRFGQDFSQVRVHADAKAAESAKAVNARAYTVGHHIVFDQGFYMPGTAGGGYLLAHELAHVLQQRPQMTADALPNIVIGEDRLQRVPQAVVAAAVAIAAIAACAIPFYLYAMSNYGHKTDKYRHCWVSCQMSKTCFAQLAELAGLTKEIRDRAVAAFCDIYPGSSICTGGHGDFLDSLGDLAANQACIPWETFFVGPLARLWRQSCKDCCDASGL